MSYISQAGLKRLKDYRYSGCDLSLWYKYVSSPLAEAIVARLPRWVAPNAITLSAFFFLVVASHLAVLWFGGQPFDSPESAQPPHALWAICAFAIFAYQTLDNADGKQARKLGVGSPIGLLLDHGCDALSTVLLAINVLSILAFDPRTEFLCIALTVCAPLVGFFFATWEEYVTGTLVLGTVNGPNEGLVIIVLLHLLKFLYPGIAHEEFFSLKFNWLILGMLILGSISAIYSNISFVFNYLSKKRVVDQQANSAGDANGRTSAKRRSRSKISEPGNTFAHKISGWEAFSLTAPLFAVLIVGFGWFAVSGIFLSYPRACIWLVGINFSKLVTHLMLAHVSGEVYQPWRRTFVVPAILIIGNILSGYLLDEAYVLHSCLALSVLSWVHMVVTVLRQMLKALNINLVTVPESVWKNK